VLVEIPARQFDFLSGGAGLEPPPQPDSEAATGSHRTPAINALALRGLPVRGEKKRAVQMTRKGHQHVCQPCRCTGGGRRCKVPAVIDQGVGMDAVAAAAAGLP
jgi:hypothetical protein